MSVMDALVMSRRARTVSSSTTDFSSSYLRHRSKGGREGERGGEREAGREGGGRAGGREEGRREGGREGERECCEEHTPRAAAEVDCSQTHAPRPGVCGSC